MDNNNNRYSRTGSRRRSHRRSQNLRPVLPNLRPSLLQNPSTSRSTNPRPLIPNFQALGENWPPSSEYWSPRMHWSPTSEYWAPSPDDYWPPSPDDYWPPPYESWPPATDNWLRAVENFPPLAEDRQSLLFPNDGQSLLTVVNRRNRRVANTVHNNVSASATEEVQVEEESDPDVVYLYSVDTSAEGHFAEEVDLTTDYAISSRRTEPGLPPLVSVEPEPVKGSKSRKRKLSDSQVTTEKRHRRNLGQPCCLFCQAHYDELRERNQFLCAARCGHTFCRPCISSKGTKKVCNICKTVIGSLYKIFL